MGEILALQKPDCGQVVPVKVELVENDGVEHLNFGKKRPVGRQEAPAGRTTKKVASRFRFFFPVGKFLKEGFNIIIVLILLSHLRKRHISMQECPDEDILGFSSEN